MELLQRHSFFVPEVEIFKGVAAWCRSNEDREDLVMKCVRLPLMTIVDLLSVVRPSGLIKSDAILDAISEKTHSKVSNLAHRGQLSECFSKLYWITNLVLF